MKGFSVDSITPEVFVGCAVVVLFALGWIAGAQR